jgi:small conductance mechanosensitive channel
MTIQKFYDHIYEWALRYGPRFLIGLITLFAGLWLIKMILNWSNRGMHRKEMDPTLKPFLVSIIGVALRVLLVLAVMQIMGIQMTLFTALVGAFGVAAGLALSGTLQNFASGILIMLLKPFVVGDNIIAQGIEGTVGSIQIFYTQVTTYDNRTVILPNSMLSNNMIINISREGMRRLDINYKFSNDTDVEQARNVIDDAIRKEAESLRKPEHRIGVTLLEQGNYTLAINVWVNAHGYEDTRLRLQEALLKNIKAAGLK